ncbi:neurofilament medium polypeptide-like [Watersipora subatra]|uniref:neurofilament medium polypeptide-like n=1 Tax=Watersipora subatra TaxID=2589382 RepID=UPI00355C30CD
MDVYIANVTCKETVSARIQEIAQEELEKEMEELEKESTADKREEEGEEVEEVEEVEGKNGRSCPFSAAASQSAKPLVVAYALAGAESEREENSFEKEEKVCGQKCLFIVILDGQEQCGHGRHCCRSSCQLTQKDIWCKCTSVV